jgi:hypothetical protein
VLGRLGRIEGVLAADPPFSDEGGIVLPLEHFEGITLTRKAMPKHFGDGDASAARLRG